METKEFYSQFIMDALNVQKQANSHVVDILKEKGKLEFDWDNGEAPSIPSTQFEDDLADSYITAMWYDNGLVKANLHAYYLGEDANDIDLADEPCVDWIDILSFIMDFKM